MQLKYFMEGAIDELIFIKMKSFIMIVTYMSTLIILILFLVVVYWMISPNYINNEEVTEEFHESWRINVIYLLRKQFQDKDSKMPNFLLHILQQ